MREEFVMILKGFLVDLFSVLMLFHGNAVFLHYFTTKGLKVWICGGCFKAFIFL